MLKCEQNNNLNAKKRKEKSDSFRNYYRATLRPPEHVAFAAPFKWFNFSPGCSDVQVYSSYPVTSPLGVATGVSDHFHPARIGEIGGKLSTRERGQQNRAFQPDVQSLFQEMKSIYENTKSKLEMEVMRATVY